MLNIKEQIAHISRNLYISDILDSIQSTLEITKVNADEVEMAIVTNSDEKAIQLWEEWMELSKEPGWTLQDRIDRVVYMINSRGFFTVQFLKDQAMIFTNSEIEVKEFFSKYHFEVEFKNLDGSIPNMDSFTNMIEVNKPAKLTFSFKIEKKYQSTLAVGNTGSYLSKLRVSNEISNFNVMLGTYFTSKLKVEQYKGGV